MVDSFIVRVKRGFLKTDVWIYEHEHGDNRDRLIAKLDPSVAVNYCDLYELLPLGFCHVWADLDDNGATFSLRTEKVQAS